MPPVGIFAIFHAEMHEEWEEEAVTFVTWQAVVGRITRFFSRDLCRTGGVS